MEARSEAADLDYLLSVGSAGGLGDVTAGAPDAAAQLPAVPVPPPVTLPVGGETEPAVADTGATVGRGTTTEETAEGDDGASLSLTNPKKRPLEDEESRGRKRTLRNRELARVSNERRKGRIRAMENELTETRQTVSTLEESVRCLEMENREMRNLLQGKPREGGVQQLHEGM